jgi:AcrR family transcriptional regulator
MWYNISTQCAEEGGIALNQEKEQLITDEMSDKIVGAAEKIVTQEGAGALNVRKILSALGITNRVFYNRFRNVDEVLEIVYKNTTMKIRKSIAGGIDSGKDFFEHVMDVVVGALIMSYENKMQFNQYVFENDSLNESNYEWWQGEIRKLIQYAKERDYIKDVDPQLLSYSIWCFCRGFNADAVARKLPREEAVKSFRYGFGFLLDGLKKQTI